MASTYPLEVVEAARWRDANPDLKDKALEDALLKQTWDPSVKSLTVFPQVLTMMNDKLDWTQKLGDIFLAQQKDVMDAVQRLRAKAKEEGNLESTEQQTVREEPAPAGSSTTTVIYVEPASPQVVYVPTYNPTVVYGAWPYPAYPPYSYYPPGYMIGASMLSFGMGMAVGGALWGDCDWNNGDVDIDVNNNFNRNTNINRNEFSNKNWEHNGEHRKGAGYRDKATQDRFGKGGRQNAASREQFRGRADQGRQQMAKQGTGAVQRDLDRAGGATAGQRDRAGSAGSQRPGSAGSQAGRGDRGTSRPSTADRGKAGGGSSAFQGDRSGSQARRDSSRGHASQQSARNRSSGGGSRGGFGGGGGGGGGGARRRRRWAWRRRRATLMRAITAYQRPRPSGSRAIEALEGGKMTVRSIRVLASCFVAGLLAIALPAATALATSHEQKHFATPEAAVEALIAALKANDRPALLALIGSDQEDLVDSGDPVADRLGAESFVERYEAAHRIQKTSATQAELEVGADHWPLPIPIVKDAAGWRFDGKAGAAEILSRRIGRNELSAIQACLAYVDAQREYYLRNPDKSPLLHYARFFASSPGRRDGLYWPVAEEGDEPSPLGPLFEEANAEGYELGKNTEPEPYHGYYYRILEGQGPRAPGGAYSYLAKNRLIGGFGLIAYPADYGNSGVMTFLVNHDGVVYQTDLGPETVARAKFISLFDLDEDTVRVAEERGGAARRRRVRAAGWSSISRISSSA